MSGNKIYPGYPKVTTDLASEPVSVADFKTFANITYTDADSLIPVFTKSARLLLEKYTGKAFGVKTIDVILSTSGRGINLPIGNVNQITALEYRGEWCCGPTPGDWENVLASTDEWSITGNRFYGGEGDYNITYTTLDIVTEDVKTAIKAQALFMFENRGDASKQEVISPVAKGLIHSLISGENLL